MIANNKVTEKHFKYIIFSIFLIVFILIIRKPVENVSDSDGYLDMVIFRSAGYPVFLSIIKNIFGSYFNFATLILQYLLGMFSIYFFIFSLRKHFKLNMIWYLLLTLILITPYIYNHHLANVFLSEALSYPLYLICVTFFLTSILTFKINPLIFSLPILFIIILTRSQFLFLIPIGIFILFWISYRKKMLKTNLWLFIIFICFPIITSMADKTYHMLKHGYFVNTPWTGICLITPAFFVADQNDYKIFNSKENQLFFNDVYSKLINKHLNIYYLDPKEKENDEIETYIERYSEIANFTVLSSGIKLSKPNLTDDQKIIAVDVLTKEMAIPLIFDNFYSWLKIYIKNFVHAFGNSKYALLFIIILIYSFFLIIKNPTKSIKIIFIISLLTVSNIALISMGIHTIKRFTFYNDWVLFLIFFILLETAFNFKIFNEK